MFKLPAKFQVFVCVSPQQVRAKALVLSHLGPLLKVCTNPNGGGRKTYHESMFLFYRTKRGSANTAMVVVAFPTAWISPVEESSSGLSQLLFKYERNLGSPCGENLIAPSCSMT